LLKNQFKCEGNTAAETSLVFPKKDSPPWPQKVGGKKRLSLFFYFERLFLTQLLYFCAGIENEAASAVIQPVPPEDPLEIFPSAIEPQNGAYF